MALCYQTCEQKRKALGLSDKLTFKKDWANTCWETCGTSTTCKATGFWKTDAGSWSLLKSFIPESKTNFAASVTCDKAKETKFGALCFPNDVKTCPSLGYQDCGVASCSTSPRVCLNTISNMVFKTIIGVFNFATFFTASIALTVSK